MYPIIAGWGWRCWRQIGRFLAEQRPDVLHIQYQAAAFDLGGWVNWLPWWLRRRRDRPQTVVTFHDVRVPYLFPKAGPLRWRSILALARYADGVIVTNVEDEQTLLQAPISNLQSRISLIPLGSNVEPCPPADYDRSRRRARSPHQQDQPNGQQIDHQSHSHTSSCLRVGSPYISPNAVPRNTAICARVQG